MQELISGRTIFIVWREALEAILIVGILYAYLKKENRSQLRSMWIGVGIGMVFSAVLAWLMGSAGQWFVGRTQVIFQSSVLAISSLLMTQMVFWMNRHGRRLKKELEEQVNKARHEGWLSVILVTALSVGREGSEAVIYVDSLAMEQKMPSLTILSSTGLGLILAFVMAWLLAQGLNLLKRQIFFKLTSLVLLFSAASLWGSAFSQLVNENMIPGLIEPLWEMGRGLSGFPWLIEAMKLLVGYNPRPSLTEVIAYGLYWLVILALLLWPVRAQRGQFPAPWEKLFFKDKRGYL